MSANIFIRNLYSPGFASLMLSFYKTNLSLSFAPWVNQAQGSRGQYDTKKFQSTTISDENAASLYFLSKSIIEGKQSIPLQYVIECNGQAKLTFEHRPDKNNQMRSYLSIEKNGLTILFEFAIHQYKTKENGQVVVKEIQSGLITFNQVMVAYLTAIGADRRLNIQQDGFGTSGTSAWSGW